MRPSATVQKRKKALARILPGKHVFSFHPSMILLTAAFFSSMSAGVFASRFRRRTGSVLLGRTLNHQSS